MGQNERTPLAVANVANRPQNSNQEGGISNFSDSGGAKIALPAQKRRMVSPI